MARRKRQRTFSREQRQANRAAIEAEAQRLGPEEVQRRADVALLDLIAAGTAASALRVAELFSELDEHEEFAGFGDVRAALVRQFGRLTGGQELTGEMARSVLDAEEDRLDAQSEAAERERAFERDFGVGGGEW